MRPDTKIIEQAIRDTGGNLSRVATVLGVSRPTVYKWIWQSGLQRLAGLDGPTLVYAEQRKPEKHTKKYVKPDGLSAPTLSPMSATATGPRVTTSLSLSETLWKIARKEAIDRGCSATQIVEQALRQFLKVKADGDEEK